MLIFASQANATHIVGGEINYKYLGNNNYEIRVTVYRDCYNGVPLFDNPASLGVFNVFNDLLYNFQMPFLFKDTVQPFINSPCLTPPTNVCYERTTYVITANLPPIPGGYQLVYQRCCRNITITNLALPDDQGITIYATIPDRIPIPVNSNPVFNNWPPPFICLNYPFEFNHSANDLDGDQIRYELCAPLNGALTTPQPNPPEDPPYAAVTWAAGYNVANMLGGTFPLKIDSITGILTAIPNTTGQFVVGVCANEYRNGILLGSTKRDFQINVVPCTGLVTAFFTNPNTQCGFDTIPFTNLSAGATNFMWNFGDLQSTKDTSTTINPSYQYNQPGTYTVTLIAFSNNPLCNDTATQSLTIYPKHNTAVSVLLDSCNAIAYFNDSVLSGGLTSHIFYDFGDGITGTIKDPVHAYNVSGTYNATIISTSQYGCNDTITLTINTSDAFNAQMHSSNNNLCFNNCNGSATVNYTGGNPPYHILWNDSLHQTTLTAINLCNGTYIVTVSDGKGCKVQRSIDITSPPLLTKSVYATDAYCKGMCIGTASITNNGGINPYQYLWNDTQQQTTAIASGLCAGTYTVIATDANGCTVTDSVTVIYSDSLPPLAATINYDTAFAGQLIQLHATQSNYNYLWAPEQLVSNQNIYNPTSKPDTGYHQFIIYITDKNGCTNSDTVAIYIKNVNCIEPELFVPSAFSPNGDNNNDVLFVKGNTIAEMDFKIFDRWGQKVFESNNPAHGWDGTFKGKMLTPAVFDYYIEITCVDAQKFYKKGNITLIR